MSEQIEKKLIGKRLLLTDRMTGIERREVKLLEISPSKTRTKFNNGNNDYWEDLDDIELLEVLHD